ncbi:MAG: YDG domain-containing protein, partial [Eubacterium sp.]
ITDKQVIHITAAVETKMYDGKTDAVLTAEGVTLNEEDKLQEYGDITLSGTAVLSFEDANVGTHKPVKLTGLSLDGTDKERYTLDLGGVTGTITPAPVDLTSIHFNDQGVFYDGKTHGLSIVGELPQGIQVTYSYLKDEVGAQMIAEEPTDSGSYQVTAAFLAEDSNYQPNPAAMEAKLTITPAPIILADIELKNQTVLFDNQSHALTITGELPENVTVAYGYKHADGTETSEAPAAIGIYTVTASFSTDANHSVSPETLTAQLVITDKQVLQVSAAVESKVYDGTTSAVLAAPVTLSGELLPDHKNVELTGEVLAEFKTADVGTDKEVILTGLSLAGADVGFYTLDLSGIKGTIKPAMINADAIVFEDKTVTAN